MNFSPICRVKKLGMMSTILGSFFSFLNWEGADIQPQIWPRKTPDFVLYTIPVCAHVCLTL